MEYKKLPNEQLFRYFLKWYRQDIEEYRWEGVPIADRINIMNQRGQLIAYKAMGVVDGKVVEDHYLRDEEYAKFMLLIED